MKPVLPLGGVTSRIVGDRGCELHPACLSCPRDVCVEDEPNANAIRRAALPTQQQINEAVEMLRRGIARYTVAELCRVHPDRVARLEAQVRAYYGPFGQQERTG